MSKKRERVTNNPQITTLQDRIALKKSYDEGMVTVYCSSEKKNKTLNDLLDSPESLLYGNDTVEIGNGLYGQAKLLQDKTGTHKVVAKITGCNSADLGDPYVSPFRPENVEPRILNFLWHHIVEKRVSPHIIAPIGSHAIVDGYTQKQKEEDDDLKSSLIFFMEPANCSDMRAHLSSTLTQQFRTQLKPLLFQICYTLAAILLRFPNFRHNDLKDDNILLHKSTSSGFTRYIVYGKTFYVPNIGYTALMCDFDFACMSGYTFDNTKTLERAWDVPGDHVNERSDHRADLYSLFAHVRHTFQNMLPKDVMSDIIGIFSLRKRQSKHERLSPPTIEEFLTNCNFFSEYLIEQDEDTVTDTWNAEIRNTPLVEFPFDESVMMKEPRHCPFIRRVQKSATALLPSQLYYVSCPPIDGMVDAGEPTDYNHKTGGRILTLIGALYTSHYKFPSQEYEKCLSLTLDTASFYLMTHLVPYKWWHAAFTCAFLDVVHEMRLAQPNKMYMTISDIGLYWEKQHEVMYKDMELLHFYLQWTWDRQS